MISSNNILKENYYLAMEDFIKEKIQSFNNLLMTETEILNNSDTYTNPESYGCEFGCVNKVTNAPFSL